MSRKWAVAAVAAIVGGACVPDGRWPGDETRDDLDFEVDEAMASDAGAVMAEPQEPMPGAADAGAEPSSEDPSGEWGADDWGDAGADGGEGSPGPAPGEPDPPAEDDEPWIDPPDEISCQPEVCDGLDNDCDGEVDEDFDLGVACGAEPGACGGGVTECNAAGTGVVCSTAEGGSQQAGAVEVCDGVDNDCDGEVDEDVQDEFVGLPCENGAKGQCRTEGRLTCERGQYICDAPAGPRPELEVCDGVDNDCDGRVDEPSASDARRWYPDCDGDGHAAMSEPLTGCLPPEPPEDCVGWTTEVPFAAPGFHDCADDNPWRYPGAGFGFSMDPAAPADGFDLDCNGVVEAEDRVVAQGIVRRVCRDGDSGPCARCDGGAPVPEVCSTSTADAVCAGEVVNGGRATPATLSRRCK